MRREKNSRELSPKIQPIRGSLMAQYKRCGRANCRCASGSKHGPFFYHVWYAQGTRHKSYVKKADLVRISAGIEAYRTQRREQRQSAEEMKSLAREIREANRNVRAILRLRGFKL
jgi:hypothetical protein